MSPMEASYGCWWYVSFADDDKFLGAVVVYGDGTPLMLQTLGSLNLNPGGEAMMVPSIVPPPKEVRGRLLTKSDIEEWDKRPTAS